MDFVGLAEVACRLGKELVARNSYIYSETKFIFNPVRDFTGKYFRFSAEWNIVLIRKSPLTNINRKKPST